MGFLSSRIKQLPNNREVLQMNNSTNLLVVTADNYFILSSQLRAGSGDASRTLGLMGGYVDEGETYRQAMERELFEEANIKSEDILFVQSIFEDMYVSEGYSSEKNTTYIVTLGKKLLELDLKCNDEGEDIHHCAIHFSEIRCGYKVPEQYGKVQSIRASIAIRLANMGR